jgi:hypothetical protein
MTLPGATIEALARRQRLSVLADVALALTTAVFIAVCLHLADASAVQHLGASAPGDPERLPTGTQVAALPSTDLGTPVMDAQARDPAPRPSNDLQRRIAEIRQGMENAVTGRDLDGLSYVSLPAAMSMVGGEWRWDRDGTHALGISEEGLARFTPGSVQADLNGSAVGIDGPPRRLGEEFYIPVRAIVSLYAGELSRDADSGLLQVRVRGKSFPVVSEQVFRMEICRGERWLRVYYAGKLAKEYPVCTGAGDNTPIGHFHIENKAEWPSWRAYWGEYMPGGSARNPLGARWLGTTARGRVTGWPIGVHGTNEPSSIGQRISGGCVRTYNANAIELYDTIPVGTPLWIHE